MRPRASSTIKVVVMLSFIQFLEELEQNHQTVSISADELDRLAKRFGTRVRQIGAWNKTDGSIEVPMSNIAEAVRALDDKQLTEALQQLRKPEQFSDMLSSSSAAVQLIEALAQLYLKQFETKVLRYQDSNDPAEAERLRQEISRELFGP
jgi:hypothetical protein